MPRKIRADGVDPSLTSPEKSRGLMTPGRLRIEEHFRNNQCILCKSFSDQGGPLSFHYAPCVATYITRAVRMLLRDSRRDYLGTSFANPYRGKATTNDTQCLHGVYPFRALGACEMRLSGLSMAFSAKKG